MDSQLSDYAEDDNSADTHGGGRPNNGTTISFAGEDEKRLQIRAYNLWVDLLTDAPVPHISALDHGRLADWDDISILLDLRAGMDNPAIWRVGQKLCAECGLTPDDLHSVADIPEKSLLSHLTAHCLQIVDNHAPVGFAAEFTNEAGKSILYRGILLPFADKEDSIDYLYGVISWKEAPAGTMVAGRATQEQAAQPIPRRALAPCTEWADAPWKYDGLDEDAMFDQLRAMESQPLSSMSSIGAEFSLAMMRRGTDNNIEFLGEIPEDKVLLRQAACKLTSN
ncbi:hypothetical protein [Altericroceibacterium endophyticum]|uniref:PAS domain-containing protein n=1 Tax=Altericroceibacterium endophyticum TaxID=1808508 RepID=A0A6I4T5S9_9SPHN|nr:hypothetical protein [Altericroceibacterium endophyticum]MXO65572.1 hypothetical protein [Altericroceibacterium endophyticum]